MNANLDKLTFSDRLLRLWVGGIYRNRSYGSKIKLKEAEKKLDIVVWNTVRQFDPKVTFNSSGYNELFVDFGNLRVVLDSSNLKSVKKCSLNGTMRIFSFSNVTIKYISKVAKSKVDAFKLDEEKEKLEKIRQNLYENFIDNKGL